MASSLSTLKRGHQVHVVREGFAVGRGAGEGVLLGRLLCTHTHHTRERETAAIREREREGASRESPREPERVTERAKYSC